MATRFEKAFEGLRTTGASVSTHEVVEALNRHGREEAELLERYQRFIDAAESPAARYLVQLILDDEKRHHRVLEELANTIAWGWTKGVPEEVVPGFPRDGDERALRAETRAFLGHELRDRIQLRRLRKRLRSYGDAPVWGLLVDLMGSDTEKHIHILRFILRITSKRRRKLSYLWHHNHRQTS
jgi:bacterioferritin (cytochrome b1)